jgi:hypothetical protein
MYSSFSNMNSTQYTVQISFGKHMELWKLVPVSLTIHLIVYIYLQKYKEFETE